MVVLRKPFFVFNFCFITALLFFSLQHVGFTSAVSRPSKPRRRTPAAHTRAPGAYTRTPGAHATTPGTRPRLPGANTRSPRGNTRISGAKMGQWKVLLNSTGVVAMHMTLTPRNTVLMLDQTETGRSGYLLRGRRYRGAVCSSSNVHDSACWAHSVEYDINANKIRALPVQTDTWCSSGAFLSNGTLLQTGGHGNGYRRIRYFHPCTNRQCSWIQSSNSLMSNRWYASDQRLPSDRVIVVGGKDVFTYEFVPKFSRNERSFSLPFLQRTYDSGEDGNNLYPFLHLSSDGNLFIFANRDSILLDYRRNRVMKTYPRIPGDGARNYPSSGSSVMLPLNYKDGFQKVEVIVCGGSSKGAYEAARGGRFLKALNNCGRMVISGVNHKWEMEHMPAPRLLNDMILLPTGQILIINGARNGAGGWNNAVRPSLEPYLYSPKKKWGRRFSVLKATKIPRLYHSSALLLPDGRVLVAGGNPNRNYTFRNVAFPTELRLQAFTPHYMDRSYHSIRPSSVSINLQDSVRYGEDFTIIFRIVRTPGKVVNFNIYAPPFTTHSISMNQRMLRLRCKTMIRERSGWTNAVLVAPPNPVVAPSGYYMLTVVNEGIPSIAQWLKLDSI
ncbi:aldehyde oxidase GLOX-like [Papaver somniferum]|uniref:aldehyde oxidase GLOX-like n=1 Tax=Papaver somniferum TaxID=3469 RepID=UPI000E6FFC73|nr:aldehyde oxidase GLOX-like [Papaver somniferum]